MNSEAPDPNSSRPPSIFKNWLSLTGLVIVVGSLFSFLLLFVLDAMARHSNPYVGILTYFVAPGFLFLGLFLTIAGAWRQRRKLGRVSSVWPKMVVDLSEPRDRKKMVVFIVGAVLFLLMSAVGSYHTYHFTESTTFCGQACHTVMKPEMVTHQHGSHARVACVECHIGPGAEWFVKAKISGTYQLYAVAFNKYPRPVPTPIKNLRPARETCEQCHWPQKFVGDLDRTYHYFLADETNTPFSVRMTMKVGGSDPKRGPVGGIHWHVSQDNKIEYWARDASRQSLPYVRVTDSAGKITEYRARGFTNEINVAELRTMDCMDCHNRPAHTYESPNDAVNLALSLGKIDRSLPYVKSNAVALLTQDYSTETEALENIALSLALSYPGAPRIRQTTEAIQDIYKDNFFPEMKASWAAYPNNIGHKDWPGCFRCHDDGHRTPDGSQTIKANDCNSCHTILAQGFGEDMNQLTPAGQKFKHPLEDMEGACNDCHTGGL